MLFFIHFLVLNGVFTQSFNESFLESFRSSSLGTHNVLRAKHGSRPLELDQNLNRFAQNYTQFLAANALFRHSQESNVGLLGENLYFRCQSPLTPNSSLSGVESAEAWYSEIQFYNFDKPGYTSKTGHFTALVWKSSSRLGVGIASGIRILNSISFNCVYVSAVYTETGNLDDPQIFKENVGRLL